MTAPETPDWNQPAPADRSSVLYVFVLIAAIAVAVVIVLTSMNSAGPDSSAAPPPGVDRAPVMVDEHDDDTAVEPTPAVGPVWRADPDWIARVSSATGIPARALAAYASADLAIGAEQPDCGVGWSTLAAIGYVETGHGSPRRRGASG